MPQTVCIRRRPGLVASAVDPVGRTDGVRLLPAVGELRRVVQDEDRPIDGGRASPRRSKMSGENVAFVDALIGQEAIGRLGIGPILAGERDASPHGVAHLIEQTAEPLRKPRVPKIASACLLINPTIPITRRTRNATRGPSLISHEAPRPVIRVLSNESQVIHRTQLFSPNRRPHRRPEFWVIESFTGRVPRGRSKGILFEL
jgi:hypothetical protein